MADITSTATGNWQDGSTWVGGVAPGASDNAIVATTHVVTIPSSVVASCTNLTINGGIVNNGELRPSGTVTGGSADGTQMGTLTLGPASIFNQPGAMTVNIFRLLSTATANSWASWTGVGALAAGATAGHKKEWNCSYVSIDKPSAVMAFAVGAQTGSGLTAQVNFQHCCFLNTGALDFGTWGYSGNSPMHLDYCDFRIDGLIRINATSGQATDTGTKTIKNSTLSISGTTEREIIARDCDYIDFSGSLMYGFFYSGSSPGHGHKFQDMFLARKTAGDSASVLSLRGKDVVLKRNYVYIPSTDVSSNVIKLATDTGKTLDVSDNIVESHASGDPNGLCIATDVATCGTIQIKRNIHIGGGAAFSYINPTTAVPEGLEISNNTMMLKTTGTYSAAGSPHVSSLNINNTNAALAAGTIIKNNLTVGDVTAVVYKNAAPATTIPGMDYNAYYGTSTIVGSNITIPEGQRLHETTGIDPLFKDSTRDLAAYAVYKSAGTTADDTVTLLLGMNGFNVSTKTQSNSSVANAVSDLVFWVKAGYVPTNSAIGTLGDGTYAGAMAVETPPAAGSLVFDTKILVKTTGTTKFDTRVLLANFTYFDTKVVLVQGLPLKKLYTAGKPLIDSKGNILMNRRVVFDLVDTLGTPVNVFDKIAKQLVISDPIEVYTDGSGEFEVYLWPNDRGIVETLWEMKVDSEDFEPLTGKLNTLYPSFTLYDFATQVTGSSGYTPPAIEDPVPPDDELPIPPDPDPEPPVEETVRYLLIGYYPENPARLALAQTTNFAIKINGENPQDPSQIFTSYVDHFCVSGFGGVNTLITWAESQGFNPYAMLTEARLNFTLTKDFEAWQLENWFGDWIGDNWWKTPYNGIFTSADELIYTDISSAMAWLSSTKSINTTSKWYIGYQLPFAELNWTFATPANTATFAIDYWNGTGWTQLSLRQDTTNNLTQNGLVEWIPPTNWVKKSIKNSVSKFWVRVRLTNVPNTMPIVSSVRGASWGTGRNLLGWKPDDAGVQNPGTIFAYNPTPPAGSDAKFAYQSWVCHTWGPDLPVFNYANKQTIGGVERYPVTEFQIYEHIIYADPGVNGVFMDDGTSHLADTGVSFNDTSWYEESTTKVFSEDRRANYLRLVNSMKSQFGTSFKVGINWWSDVDNEFMSGDWGLYERWGWAFAPDSLVHSRFVVHNPPSYGAPGYDDFLTRGPRLNAFQYVDSTDSLTEAYQVADVATFGAVAWDRGNRGPIICLAKHLIGWNKYVLYNYTNSAGSWYGDPLGTYQLRDESYVDLTAGGALPTDMTTVLRWGPWYPAMAVDFGIPDINGHNGGARDVAWNGMWRRDWTNCIAIVRPEGNRTGLEITTPCAPINLGGTYYPLLANGKTGPAVTSVSIRAIEGIILMKAPIV